MARRSLVLGFMIVTTGLAGCQAGAPGAQPLATTAAGQPILLPMPADDDGLIAKNRVKRHTREWTDENGVTHRETTTTRTDNSLEAAAAFANVVLGQSAPPETVPDNAVYADNPAGYPGDWQVSVNGKTCRVTLEARSFSGRQSARSFGCFGSELSRANAWSLRGTDLVLSGFGEQIADLRVTEANRMDGKLADGTKLVLWR
ncbi:AprI/Inh family metalloprotease inhibitor [Roseibium sp. RKSG952]|uniref:AprI/Inh family metalloprotease inhibitor n=1 Tax=Roseibium sp. RKSG952 TaxID=2529384 RepID=UPI0012BB7C9E|nr:AprI/Inh family metalloprotease inhibitor [Roseibium sp. RKSG952]MTH99554.1 hypothetical protein [Roseibium sp. RKSG952]